MTLSGRITMKLRTVKWCACNLRKRDFGWRSCSMQSTNEQTANSKRQTAKQQAVSAATSAVCRLLFAYLDKPMNKINLLEKLALINDHWNPRIIGELNGQYL